VGGAVEGVGALDLLLGNSEQVGRGWPLLATALLACEKSSWIGQPCGLFGEGRGGNMNGGWGKRSTVKKVVEENRRALRGKVLHWAGLRK